MDALKSQEKVVIYPQNETSNLQSNHRNNLNFTGGIGDSFQCPASGRKMFLEDENRDAVAYTENTNRNAESRKHI